MRARTGAYTALAVVASIFAACLVVQVFLAGLGVFDSPSAFMTHATFGFVIEWLTLVMLLIAAFGRLGRRLIGLTALTLVQLVLQSVFVAVRDTYPMVAALHPVNGFAVLLVTILIARLAWQGRQAAIATTAAAAAAGAVSSSSPAEARS
jgi:uncharacterized protein DUF6220